MNFIHYRYINKNIYKLFILLILYISCTNLLAEEKIGSVTDISGSAISINQEGDEKELAVFDPIFLNEEIFVSEQSVLTIQYNDNTTVIIKELSSLSVSEFENSEVRKKFKGKTEKGEIIIESGSIAKASDGEMLLDVSNIQLGVRGTRINIGVTEKGDAKVALAEDSFGNVGEIALTSEGQTENLVNAEQVIEVSQNREISRREQTTDEKEELVNVNKTLVDVSKINENELDEKLERKLEEGKLEDANNDGVIDATDIKVVKENIKIEKQANLDFIVENSKTDNTEFLSDVLDQSDEKNIGETITKIIEVKENLIEDVVDNLSDKENTFITSSSSDEVVAVKEKIFETIVSNESDNSAEVLSKVMSKSDDRTIKAVINNITEKNLNDQSTLSLKVMADFSEKNPEKLEQLEETSSEDVEKLTIDAVQKASASNEDVDLIAKVVAVTSDDIVNKVVEEVSKSSTEEKQNLSAKVLKAIVDTEPTKIDIIEDEIKDLLIEQTIEAVKIQEEKITDIPIVDDLTDIVAEIIVKTDNSTASKIIEEVTNIETEKNISLKVIAGISEKDSEKLTSLNETNKNEIEKFTEVAVQKAENTTQDSELIAKVVSVVNDELANKVVEEVSKSAVNEKQSLSVKVLKAIVDTEPERIEIINEEVKDDLIEKAIEATKDQQEGTLIEEEDLTDAVSEIIVKTDTNTAAKVIEEINDIVTETNLSLEVISAISEKDESKLNDLSENLQEEIQELTEQAISKAENTTEDSQKIAKVVSVVNDDLVNIMVEEVSKVSTEEKQTLSAKVLKAIVDTEPDKIEVINDEIKDTMIQQTIDATKDQQEGISLEDEDDLTDLVAEIIVNADTETAEKIIDEVNEIDTETNLSLKVISGISEKDNQKLDILAINNQSQIEELTQDAVQNAENTDEDSELIAQVVSVVNDDLANKVVEQVNNAVENNDEKETLSAKVLNALVENDSEKIESISEENIEKLIENTVDVAKKQNEGDIIDDTNYTDVISDIIINSETDTASKVLEEIDETETESNLKLDIVTNLNKDENFDEVLEDLKEQSENNDQILSNIVDEVIDNIEDDEDFEKITDIIKDSEGSSLTDKIIESGNKSEDNKQVVSEVLEEVAKEDPDKVIDIIEKTAETEEIVELIEDKIENEEAITIEDFEEVFDINISPN